MTLTRLTILLASLLIMTGCGNPPTTGCVVAPAPFPAVITGTVSVSITHTRGVNAIFSILVGSDGIVSSIVPGPRGESVTVTFTSSAAGTTITAAGDGDDEINIVVSNAAGASLCSVTIPYETS